MSWFGKKEWAVVMMTHGSAPFGVDGRKHVAIAVRHWPQINAATILTGLSRSRANREVARLNDLNHPNKRAMRIADLCGVEEQPQ
ncbi:hypothetical protein ACWQV9_09900 [Brevundimonas diminuta]